MFDIGWSELLLIGMIVLFAFGPEDIPKIMYNLGRALRRFRYMRYALSSQFEDFMEKAESQGKTPKPNQPVKVAHDDEADDDAHLIDMMPIPASIKETNITDLPDIDNETNDRPNPTVTDRG